MKKVVLLAGVVAAGMAAAPVAANAASPKAPEIKKINFSDFSDFTALQAHVADMNQEAQDYFSTAKRGLTLPNLDSSYDWTELETAITNLNTLDGDIQTYFSAHNDGASDWDTSCSDDHDLVTEGFRANFETYAAAYYTALNKAIADDYKASSNYQDLQDALAAADVVIVPNAPYNDAIYADVTAFYKAALQAQVTDAGTKVADKVDAYEIANNQNTLSHYVDIKSDAGSITTKINNLLDEFYKKANTVAKDALLKKYTDHNFDQLMEDVVDTEAEGLAHHPEAADDTAVQTEKTAAETEIGNIKTWIEGLDPSAIPYSPNPDAVQAWADKAATGGFDEKISHADDLIEAWQEAIYNKALDLDEQDIADAIGNSTSGVLALVDALSDSPVKTHLNEILTDPAVTGSIAADQQAITDARAASTDICNDFATIDQKVTDLKARIANLEAAMTDIADLNADVVALQQEIDDQASEDGYAPFTTDWTTTEQGDLDTVIADINTAIDNITKADDSWVGKDHFDNDITTEYDHHDWLAEWQQANYDAKEKLVDEIDLRYNEYRSVAESNLTADDCVQVGVNFEDIVGEDVPTDKIYQIAFFDDIYAQFTDEDPALAADGDIRYDRINDAYDNKNAQTIGDFTEWKNAADAAAKAALVAGYLKDVTAEGVEDVLVEGAPTAKADVVFGELQKTIQNAYAKIVENEKANKALHDAYEETEQYIADAKTDIDTYAKLNFKADAKDIQVFNFVTRVDDTHSEAAIDFVGEINWKGTPTGVDKNYAPSALTVDDYLLENTVLDPTEDATVDYDAIVGCDHEPSSVWGWTVIGTNMTDLKALEQKEYDAVRSKKLLDGETKYTDSDSNDLTFEETLTKVEENVDDITNEAYTQMVRNGLAYVQSTLNAAKVWAQAVDNKCDESPRDPEDLKNNPCGWDAKTPKNALKQIVEDWNEQLTNLGTAHNAETADNHATAEDNFLKFQEYVTKALVDIRAWQAAFAAADKTHKQNILNAYDLAVTESHTIHHYSQEADLAVKNYTDGEKAAADLWAVDFNLREIGTYNGQKVTFQQFVKIVDDALAAIHKFDHTSDPDLYAAVKKIADNGITCFQDYIDGTKYLDEYLETYAELLRDEHFYTELKKLAEGIKNFNWKADFQKVVDANNAAKVELLKQLATAQATLDAAHDALDPLKVYSAQTLALVGLTEGHDDYTNLNTTAFLTAQSFLNKEKDEIEKSWKLGQAADYSADGKDDLEVKGYKFAETDGKKKVDIAIDTYVAAVHAAEALYQTNHEAYQALEAALAEFEAVAVLGVNAISKAAEGGALYTIAIDGEDNDSADVLAKAALLGLGADGKVASEHEHFINEFKEAKLAEKSETEKGHLAQLAVKLKNVEDALLKAVAFKAKNVENYEKLYAELQAAEENLATLNTEYAALDTNTVYNVEGRKDLDTIKGLVEAARKLVDAAETDNVPAALTKALNNGKVYTDAEVTALSAKVAAITTAVEAARAEILKDVKFYAQNVKNFETLYAEYQAAEENVGTLKTDWETAKDNVYEVEGRKDKTAVQALVDALKPLDVKTALETARDNGKAYTAEQVDALRAQVTKLTTDVEAARKTMNEDVEFYAKSVETRDKLVAEYNDALNNKKTLDTEWNAVKDNVYAVEGGKNHKKDIQDAIDALKVTETIGDINKAFDTAKVIADEATLKGEVKDLNDAVEAARKLIAEKVEFYAAEHALADELDKQVDDLEVLLKSLDTVWAGYGELVDSDKDLKALKATKEAIATDIKDERTAIDTDLAAGNVQANEADHNTAIAEIKTAIEKLQKAVMDIEEYKATNEKNYVTLREATSDLLASLDDVKYVSDDVYETLPATEAAADLDQESIEAAREAAKTLATTELTALENALATGKLYTDAEVAAQQAKIDEVADALEALKEQVKAAEDFRRANAEANDKLEEKVQALVTIINTAKANSVCDLCNEEDTADLEAELDAVYEILGNVAESFAVGHLAMPTAADNYAKYMQDLIGVEANVQATLDEIAEHKVRQINDQNAYNVLQKALTDVDLWLANVQLEEGWENFAVRGAHADETSHVGATSNETEGLKYLNELTDGVNDLKALIETQHSHEGGHVCEENKIDDMKAMQALIKDAKTLIEAIHANEAAHKLIMDRFDDLYADALDAYNFWHTYYTEYSTLTDNWYTANKGWVEEYNGELEPGEYLDMLKDMLHDSYVHGAAAYDWTVGAKGEELNDKANTTFAGYDADLASDRNDLAHKEALNHYNAVRQYVEYEYGTLRGEYDNYDYWTDTWTKDPFTADLMDLFLDEIEGEYGIFKVLNDYKADIEAAFAEGVMEDAINIDERNHALGIHQQLGGVKSVFNGILAEYKDLFEDAHHLTNGKKIYSDQEYFTLGFFKKANDGSVENGQEMFKEVKVLVNDDIRLYDSRAYVWNDMGTPDDWSDDEALVDEKGRVVYDKENNPGEIAEVTVLTVGQKSNELSFNFHQNPMALERATLKAGTAEVDFLPGSISVKNDDIDTWVVKHTVSIDGIDVLTPEVAEMEITPYAASNKLIVRLDAPIDLTYTINSLVARTDDGTEFSYADRELNYAARTIEFTLPEGTASVELPEGFFTFRTGENTIARSAAMTVTVGTATSIEGLIAMGDKAQIFDLQGRRVKAEALISGNTYVVNGEKVMVK